MVYTHQFSALAVRFTRKLLKSFMVTIALCLHVLVIRTWILSRLSPPNVRHMNSTRNLNDIFTKRQVFPETPHWNVPSIHEWPFLNSHLSMFLTFCKALYHAHPPAQIV